MKHDFARLMSYFLVFIIVLGLVIPMGRHWIALIVLVSLMSYAFQWYFNKHLKNKQ